MKVNFRCISARMSFDPYREYCSLGFKNCAGCKFAILQTIRVSAETMIQDERHETKAYDYTTGRLERTW